MTQRSHFARPSAEEIAALRASGTFDEAWYLREYPDVARTGLDAAEHYLWLGRRLGRAASRRDHDKAIGVGLSWCIVATPHVLFIAHTLARGLRRHGWSVEIVVSMPDYFPHDYYIVLCAQMFDHLPPGEKRIIYQLEQSASSRWFSDRYLNDMENSFAVLEYSMQNMAFLEGKGIAFPHVHYLPIGASSEYHTNDIQGKDIDILFYGDFKSSPRRQKLLEFARSKYNIRCEDSIFGEDIKRIISRSKLVLNLHYYENAQLEMPRIQECLSLGVPVVSESTRDQGDYEGLEGAVTFFNAGDPAALLDSIASVQENAANTAAAITDAVQFWERRHQFMLDRFLIGSNICPVDTFDDIVLTPLSEDSMVALSLPETTERRNAFDRETRTAEMMVFDGLRRRPGWIGCGMSYKYLCTSAVKSELSQLTILEDDALLSADHSIKMKIIQEFLRKNEGQWDVFCGLIADLHDDTEVLNVENFDGLEFVTINRMTSMVYNIYTKRILGLIANWDQSNQNAEINTIDRYLENSDLKVVVTYPYLVGHREELSSTLWGFQNSQYGEMIVKSEAKLKALKDRWLDKDLAMSAPAFY